MLKRKSAQVLGLFIVLAVTAGMIYAFTVIMDKKATVKKEYMGETQFELIELFNKGKKADYYVENSAKQAASQSAYDLAVSGGIINPDKCGTLGNFNLWNSENQECYPSKNEVINDFNILINGQLNLYLDKYTEVDIPEDNYDFTVTEKGKKIQVIGTALENIFLPHKPPKKIDLDIDSDSNQVKRGKSNEEYDNMFFSIKPSFNIDFNYDFGDYDYLEDSAKSIIENVILCETNNELGECIQEQVNELNQKDAEEPAEFLSPYKLFDSSSANLQNKWKFLITKNLDNSYNCEAKYRKNEDEQYNTMTQLEIYRPNPESPVITGSLTTNQVNEADIQSKCLQVWAHFASRRNAMLIINAQGQTWDRTKLEWQNTQLKQLQTNSGFRWTFGAACTTEINQEDPLLSKYSTKEADRIGDYQITKNIYFENNLLEGNEEISFDTIIGITSKRTLIYAPVEKKADPDPLKNEGVFHKVGSILNNIVIIDSSVLNTRITDDGWVYIPEEAVEHLKQIRGSQYTNDGKFVKTSDTPRTIPFCVKNTGKNLIAYNDQDKTIKSRNPIYKFALFFVNPSLEQVNEFEIINPSGTDNQLLLKWKKQKTITEYRLSYENQEIALDPQIPENIQYNPEECTFSQIGEKCSPYIENNKLYENNEEYLYYLISGLDKKEYEFSISVTDSEGNDIHQTKKTIVRDNLAPGRVGFSLSSRSEDGQDFIVITHTKPNKNIDNSLLLDLEKYFIFTKESNCDSIIGADSYVEADPDTNPIEIPKPAGQYCVAIIAADKNNNPMEIKLKPGSLTDKELETGPEYISVINELANPQQITLS